MPRPLVLLLGDSITQGGSDWTRGGWICRLMDRYSRSLDIAQRGMSGYSTQSFMNLVVDKLAHDLSTSLRPQLITLFLGANDAALLTGPGAPQHVPLPKYKTNLRYLLQLFRERAPQAKVLLIAPPAVDESVGNWGRTNNATGEYAHAMVQVAKERNVPVLDLHTIFNALPEAQWKGMLKDGLHFNIKGNEFMEQLLVDMIKTTFPDLQKQLDQKEYPQDWLATQAPSPWPWPPWQLPPPWDATMEQDAQDVQVPTDGGGMRRLLGVSSSQTSGGGGGVDASASSLFAVPVMVACAVLVGIAAVVGRRRVRAAKASVTLP